MRWFLLNIPLLILFSLVIAFGFGLQLNIRTLPTPLLNQSLPHFNLAILSEPKHVFTEQDIKGPALINVWASWCASCLVEHQFLMYVAEKNLIPIYGLNYKDNRQAALHWLQQYGDPYQKNAFDQKGNVAIDFGVYGAPELFLIDRSGRIRYKHVGVVSKFVWEQELKPLILRLTHASA